MGILPPDIQFKYFNMWLANCSHIKLILSSKLLTSIALINMWLLKNKHYLWLNNLKCNNVHCQLSAAFYILTTVSCDSDFSVTVNIPSVRTTQLKDLWKAKMLLNLLTETFWLTPYGWTLPESLHFPPNSRRGTAARLVWCGIICWVIRDDM